MSNALLRLAEAHEWAMEAKHLLATLRAAHEFATGDIVINGSDSDEERAPYELLAGGVAAIDIVGTIVPSVPKLWKKCGCEACGLDDFAASIDAALADDAVAAILLRVDSPGGVIDGVQEAGDRIFSARARKPVHAAIANCGASAAYWLAAQAETVAANITAHVGSIGVYTWVVDSSEAYQSEGFRVHLIASGPLKGQGAIGGVPVSEEALKVMHENINDLADLFRAAVMRGRGMSRAQVETVSTGRTWIAPRTLRTGLIDHVENLDETLARILT